VKDEPALVASAKRISDRITEQLTALFARDQELSRLYLADDTAKWLYLRHTASSLGLYWRDVTSGLAEVIACKGVKETAFLIYLHCDPGLATEDFLFAHALAMLHALAAYRATDDHLTRRYRLIFCHSVKVGNALLRPYLSQSAMPDQTFVGSFEPAWLDPTTEPGFVHLRLRMAQNLDRQWPLAVFSMGVQCDRGQRIPFAELACTEPLQETVAMRTIERTAKRLNLAIYFTTIPSGDAVHLRVQLAKSEELHKYGADSEMRHMMRLLGALPLAESTQFTWLAHFGERLTPANCTNLLAIETTGQEIIALAEVRFTDPDTPITALRMALRDKPVGWRESVVRSELPWRADPPTKEQGRVAAILAQFGQSDQVRVPNPASVKRGITNARLFAHSLTYAIERSHTDHSESTSYETELRQWCQWYAQVFCAYH